MDSHHVAAFGVRTACQHRPSWWNPKKLNKPVGEAHTHNPKYPKYPESRTTLLVHIWQQVRPPETWSLDSKMLHFGLPFFSNLLPPCYNISQGQGWNMLKHSTSTINQRISAAMLRHGVVGAVALRCTATSTGQGTGWCHGKCWWDSDRFFMVFCPLVQPLQQNFMAMMWVWFLNVYAVLYTCKKNVFTWLVIFWVQEVSDLARRAARSNEEIIYSYVRDVVETAKITGYRTFGWHVYCIANIVFVGGAPISGFEPHPC